MPIQLLSNLNYPIGDIICHEMSKADNIQIAVAFLKYSGIRIIEKSVKDCLARGGSIELIVGLDFKTTDAKSLAFITKLKKEFSSLQLYCFGDRKENKTNVVFHPKIYLFKNKIGSTGIVGSTNLTQGGLLTNFEVNTIFRESKPVYFSQLQAIYNSVKYTDSIFIPDEEYIECYSDIYKAFENNETKAKKDTSIKKIIKEVQEREEFLPGTIPTVKSLIIAVIRQNQSRGQEFTSLKDIYEKVEALVKESDITKHYKMDTFRNTIRGELNAHEYKSNSAKNMDLFVRSPDRKGLYSLTEKGKSYQGR